jgi:hypothetical protein
MALIKHRGIQNFEDDVSKAILYWVRYLCVRCPIYRDTEANTKYLYKEESFKTCKTVEYDPGEWANIPQYTVLPANSSLDGINLNLARLQAAIPQDFATGSDSTSLDIKDIIEAARGIDRQLIEWSGTLPLSWLATRVTGEDSIPPSIGQAGLYQSHCHVYKSIQIAYLWNRQRLSRIRAQKIMLTQLLLQEPSLSNRMSQASCQNTIQQLADDICATLPFYLGDRTKPGRLGDRNVEYPHARGSPIPETHYQMAPAMGGYQLLGALGTLLRFDIILRNGQKQWIGGQLVRLARICRLILVRQKHEISSGSGRPGPTGPRIIVSAPPPKMGASPPEHAFSRILPLCKRHRHDCRCIQGILIGSHGCRAIKPRHAS